MIDATQLRDLMRSDRAWALFDVREVGEAEEGHILGATFLPRRMIEFRIAHLVPLRATTIVVYDEGGARAELAAATLRELGYTDVEVLEGGTEGWRAAGLTLIDGNNVPSKLFGEKVHDQDHTPGVSAQTVETWRREGRAALFCDIRTPQEYERSRIPGSYSTPGFDVGLCMPDIGDRSVPVVVNCAGRTRSIIACETLRQLGMKEVYALENGTMGWVLAGHALEKGDGLGVIAPTVAGRAKVHPRALALAQSAGAGFVDPKTLNAWIGQRDRGEMNLYVFDARQTDEYDAGHIEGTTILPGALAVQRTDEFMPVRQGQVVFIDDDETRALLASYWLKRMGFPNVAILKGGVKAWTDAGLPLTRGRMRQPPLGLEQATARTEAIDAQELRKVMQETRCVTINVDTSAQFSRGHLPGSSWVPRGWLEQRISALTPGKDTPIVVTCRDGQQSVFAAAALRGLGYRNAFVLAGGLKTIADWPLVEGTDAAAAEAKDVILPPYAKGQAGMRRYLEWETKLTSAHR